MWTLDFKPEKDVIGTLVATWNAGQPDEFVFAKSVNLNAPDSMQEFRAVAEKYRQVHENERAKTYQAVIDLQAEMNK